MNNIEMMKCLELTNERIDSLYRIADMTNQRLDGQMELLKTMQECLLILNDGFDKPEVKEEL